MLISSALQRDYVGFVRRWYETSQIKENVHSWKLKRWNLHWGVEWNACRGCWSVSRIDEKRLKKSYSKADPHEYQKFKISYYFSIADWGNLSIKKVLSSKFLFW